MRCGMPLSATAEKLCRFSVPRTTTGKLPHLAHKRARLVRTCMGLHSSFLPAILLAVLSVAGASAATDPTPKSSDVVISAPTIWSLVGIEGDVHEIWSGPKDEKGAPPGAPQ